MQAKIAVILSLILVLAAYVSAAPPPSSEVITNDIVTISVQQQYESVKPGSKSTLAVHLELKKGWHFYASAKTAPGGMNLKLKPLAENYISFSAPIFPKPKMYLDKSSGEKLEVFSDNFTVYLPFTVSVKTVPADDTVERIKINIEGAVCSDVQCRMPDFGVLSAQILISPVAVMSKPKFALPEPAEAKSATELVSISQWAGFPIWFALSLAFLAGVILNIMPCVLPVIPLKVLSIFEQAKESRTRCIAMGFLFCLGILLFFVALAVLNIVLRIGYNRVFQWGDHFRNPTFLIAMSLLMMILSLFMFGLFTVVVPSSIAGRLGGGKGYYGSIAMGVLAAILSTPCSFAILTAAFAWAQTQKLALATVAIMLIGVGMAAPYAILTSMPGLLKYLPRPGRWMELFKQSMGFVLLLVAAWLLMALPAERRGSVLYFSMILAFCIWMWGGWVTLTTPSTRRWLIRIIAVGIAVSAAIWLLPENKTGGIDWKKYDPTLVETAVKEHEPVLVEFTADWCLTCKAVEKTVYSNSDIVKLIKDKGVLAIKANTTQEDSMATVDLKKVYNEPGVPVTILFVPGTTEPERLHGLLIGDKLKKLLEKLPAK